MNIRWYLGVPAVGAAGVALLLTTAAMGDQVYLKHTGETVVSGAPLSCIGDWAVTVWPGIAKAKVQTFECAKTPATPECSLREERTVTLSEFAVLAGEGVVESDPNNDCRFSKVDDDVTYCHIIGPTALTAAQVKAVKACLDDIWAGTAVSVIERLYMRKDAVNKRVAYYEYWTTDTDENWYADFLAGVGGGPSGTVE